MWRRAAALVLSIGLVVTTGAQAQHPRIGIGATAGTMLGSELMDHRFDARLDGRTVSLTQEVDLREVVVAGIEGEWYVSSHVAVRAQASRGSGRLAAETYRDEVGDTEAAAFESGFGNVGLTALDVGLSVWPWTPGSVGFAPFVTVGYGMVAYDFRSLDREPESFFRASGTRRQGAIVAGAGADMRIWSSVALRLEATNHMVESPLAAADFTTAGERRAPANAALGDRISNMRLVLGAHVYLPFGGNGPTAN